ncbi:hypothetical protein GCM10011574_20450 [Microbispora bryophytorum]|uniref:Uncharacterized protein n=1 Tax=Microbispora bryophytorum TaxID=1460882 RepID=A0A8H9H2N9_9ACTN|nr:hypothetical protein GCM10011574_20450 [Microbispora bryophytorum]
MRRRASTRAIDAPMPVRETGTRADPHVLMAETLGGRPGARHDRRGTTRGRAAGRLGGWRYGEVRRAGPAWPGTGQARADEDRDGAAVPARSERARVTGTVAGCASRRCDARSVAG